MSFSFIDPTSIFMTIEQPLKKIPSGEHSCVGERNFRQGFVTNARSKASSWRTVPLHASDLLSGPFTRKYNLRCWVNYTVSRRGPSPLLFICGCGMFRPRNDAKSIILGNDKAIRLLGSKPTLSLQSKLISVFTWESYRNYVFPITHTNVSHFYSDIVIIHTYESE